MSSLILCTCQFLNYFWLAEAFMFSEFTSNSVVTYTELMKVRKQLDDYNRTASASDQMVRELQSRESDLMEALQAKDSQLAILRVRLEEADKVMESKQRSIDDLESQRERWV